MAAALKRSGFVPYYLSVDVPSYYYNGSSYSVTANLVAGSVEGFESESNDTFATADTLALGTAITGQLSSSTDIDAYKLTVSAAGNASANYIQGALGDDLLAGLGGNDTLDGGRADDTLQDGAGNDTLYGGLGTDYAAFAGAANKYSWAKNTDGSITLTDTGSGFNEGADKLYDMEWLVFNYGTSSESKVLISQLVTPGWSRAVDNPSFAWRL